MNECFAPVRDLVREPVGAELRLCLYRLHAVLCGVCMQKRLCRVGQNKKGADVQSKVDLNVSSS